MTLRVDQGHIRAMLHQVVIAAAGHFVKGDIELRTKAVQIQKLASHCHKVLVKEANVVVQFFRRIAGRIDRHQYHLGVIGKFPALQLLVKLV